MLAPIGGLESIVEGGAAAAARAAAQFGVPQMLSSVCQPGLEADRGRRRHACACSSSTCAATTPGWTISCAARRTTASRAFCLTVDVAVVQPARARPRRPLRQALARDARPRARRSRPGSPGTRSSDTRTSTTTLPLIIKGIATAEDAELAVQHGVEVVYVSNHGGRQLDHGLGSAAVLPEIVKAVAGKAEVWVDGGFMRGTDVVKAIALGAKAVGIGRLCRPRPRRGGRAGPGAHARAARGRDPHLPRPARRHLLRRADAGAPRGGAGRQSARYVQRVSAASARVIATRP